MTSPAAERYDRGLWLLEAASLRRLRRQLLADVTGQVLEVGMGTGANLPLYERPSFVAGIDLRPEHLAGAVGRAARPPVGQAARPPVGISCANAQRLPFGDGRFDNVVSTLVFCSIPQPEEALAEIRRVLKPNGRLWMLEHVRGLNPISRRLTDWLHPAWFALQHECHLNRETAVTVQQAGFTIEQTSTHGFGIIQMIKAVSCKL